MAPRNGQQLQSWHGTLLWGHGKVMVSRRSCSESCSPDLLRQSRVRTGRLPKCGRHWLRDEADQSSNPVSATYQMCDFEHEMCGTLLDFSFSLGRMEITTLIFQGEPSPACLPFNQVPCLGSASAESECCCSIHLHHTGLQTGWS